MANYSSLKATLNANIKTNGNQEITGAITNSVLNAMVNSLGAGYQFMGVATPTNPGSAQTPDYKCFYLATTPGTYTYLGGLVVADGEVALLKWDTSWTKEVTGIASAQEVDKMRPIDITEDFSIIDDNNFRILVVNDGHLRTKEFDSRNVPDNGTTPKEIESNNDFSIVDSSGNNILSIDGGHIRTKNFNSHHQKKLMHIIGYGQSTMAGSYSGVPMSVAKYPNIYKFKGGIRTYDKFNLNTTWRQTHITRTGEPAYGELFLTPQTSLSANDYQILTDALSELMKASETRGTYTLNGNEYVFDVDGNTLCLNENGETPLTSFANEYNRQVSKGVDGFTFDYDMLLSCAAYGSATYKSLLPLDRGGETHEQSGGSDESNLNYFEVLMSQVVAGKRIADAGGYDYSVDYIFYFEEHTDIDSNTNVNVVACRILQLFSLINSRVRSVTGQRNDIIFVVPSSHLGTRTLQLANYLITTGHGELQLSDAEKTSLSELINYDIAPYSMDNVIGGIAHYGYPVVADNIHHSTIGQIEIGTTIGANLGNKDNNPLHPASARVFGNDIYLTYDINVAPLVIDTTLVSSQTNYGFHLYSDDDVNVEVDIITGVSIVESNMVKIECSESPTGLKLAYGLYPRKGNLRDSQETQIYNTHNWAYIFKIQL